MDASSLEFDMGLVGLPALDANEVAVAEVVVRISALISEVR